jgi:hypothetical protein
MSQRHEIGVKGKRSHHIAAGAVGLVNSGAAVWKISQASRFVLIFLPERRARAVRLKKWICERVMPKESSSPQKTMQARKRSTPGDRRRASSIGEELVPSGKETAGRGRGAHTVRPTVRGKDCIHNVTLLAVRYPPWAAISGRSPGLFGPPLCSTSKRHLWGNLRRNLNFFPKWLPVPLCLRIPKETTATRPTPGTTMSE